MSLVDTALLDAELFLSTSARASIKRYARRLNATALDSVARADPRAIVPKQLKSGTQSCAGKSYVERAILITYERLLEAKQLIGAQIASGLEAIRRARRPDLGPQAGAAQQTTSTRGATLAGDLSAINMFDAIQVIENAKLTGTLTLKNDTQNGQVFFNEGRIVDAESVGERRSWLRASSRSPAAVLNYKNLRKRSYSHQGGEQHNHLDVCANYEEKRGIVRFLCHLCVLFVSVVGT